MDTYSHTYFRQIILNRYNHWKDPNIPLHHGDYIQIVWQLCPIMNITVVDINWKYADALMTSSNGNIFRVTGHLCGEFTGHRWIPLTKASDAELWCFFDLRLNKRLSK